MRGYIILFLLLRRYISLPVAHGYSVVQNGPTAKTVSSEILKSLRDTSTGTNNLLLNLETDFYDSTTGLYSEGVWHNGLAGIASLQLDEPSNQIADSLFRYSWDGSSFRRRSWSGIWDHSTIESDNPPEQANYYRASSEHRCVQHGTALIFWSRLVLKNRWDGDTTDGGREYVKQQRLIADCFLNEFYDTSVNKWTTVSRVQGGGSIRRPSASAAKQTLLGSSSDTPYYRAVDQAIAVLACLEHLELLGRATETSAIRKEQDTIKEVVRTTCQQIMSPDGFGYGNIKEAKSYLGLDRNRNFWHDGWTLLALIQARCYLWPSDTDYGRAQYLAMWNDLIDMYGHYTSSSTRYDGTVWHWPRKFKNDSSNVRYCGDNALAHAIRRTISTGGVSSMEDEKGFSMFISGIRNGNERGLASVADVYPQVRLHPNTELAALLVWP